jgi:hypothetical protein
MQDSFIARKAKWTKNFYSIENQFSMKSFFTLILSTCGLVGALSHTNCLAYDDIVHGDSMGDFDLNKYQGLWYVASTNGKI